MLKRLFFWAITSLFVGSSSYASKMEDAVIGRLTLDGETISGVKRLQMDSSNKVLLASGPLYQQMVRLVMPKVVFLSKPIQLQVFAPDTKT